MAGSLGDIRAQVHLDIRQAVAAYATLRAQNARTVYAMRGTGDSFVHAGRTMSLAGLGLIAVFGKAVQAAANFERKMDFFQAVTGTSKKQMDALNKVTLEIAKNTIFNADEMASGMIELGKAGVSAKDIIAGIGQAMANLAAAGDIPLAQSGQIITSTLNQFDLGANKAVHVVDLLAGAANASIADIEDIGVSLKYVGGVANATGASLDDTITAISLLAKAGIRGSTAGTSLRQMLVSLPGVTAPAYAQLKDLGIITEDNKNRFYDLHGNLKPLPRVFQILHNSLQGMTKEQKLVALRTIFNNRALAAAAILTRDGAKGFRGMNAEMRKTTAAETAHKRLDNLSGDLEILRGNIETMVTEAGGPFQETLRKWVQALTGLVQGFSKLSPGTQKFILEAIGISGVVLLAMGAFIGFIGIIFRTIAAAKKLWAGIRLLVTIVRTLLWIFGIITGGAISGVFLAIAAAVIAVGIAFVIAYKKIGPFRDFINGIGKWFMSNVVHPIISGIGSLVKWFGTLATNPSKAWDQLKTAAGNAVDAIGRAIARLPGVIGNGLKSLVGMTASLIGQMVRFWLSLPGRILGAIVSMVPKIISFFGQLPGRIGYIIGFLVTRIPAMFVMMGLLILRSVIGLVGLVVSGFASLAPKVGYAIGFMIGLAIRLMIQLTARMVSLAAQLVVRVVSFFASLPGRVAAFVSAMVTRAINLFNIVRTRGPALAREMVIRFVGFLAALPGRVGSIIQNMASRAINIASRLPGKMAAAGRGMLNGLKDGIKGMPGAVGNILGNCISAIRGKITEAFNAVRSFASNMWKGFKNGLGMKSPSLIEKAMWQITDTVGTEAKRLGKQTMQVQNLSKKMARTQFGVGDVTGASNVGSMIAAKKIASAQVASSVKPNNRPIVTATVNTPAQQQITGQLRLTPDSRVFVEGVAQDVVDYNASYADALDGM